jgi:sugar lactone lactonase YvrE
VHSPRDNRCRDRRAAGSLFSEGDRIGDGIKIDKRGNVFSTGGAGPGEVRIMAPDGKLLSMRHVPLRHAPGRSRP